MKIPAFVSRERKRLEKMYRYHMLNHRDTGSERNLNLMRKYEDEAIALDKMVELFNNLQLREVYFKEVLKDILDKADSLMSDYRYEQGIIPLKNYMVMRMVQWQQGVTRRRPQRQQN